MGPAKRAPRAASTKPKAEPRTGTCQGCLRTVRLTTAGTMYRHGWDFEHHGGHTGVHIGQCEGVGQVPLEMGHDLTLKLAGKAAERANDFRSMLAAKDHMDPVGPRRYELESWINAWDRRSKALYAAVERVSQ